MTSFETVISSTTVTNGGGTTTSSSIEFISHSTATVKVEGDGNSDDFDIELQGRFEEGGNFGVYDDSVSGENITSDTNDARFYTYDVSDLNDGRLKFTNNGGSDTTVTIKVGKTRGDQR